MKKFKTVADIVASRLCVGCGACAPICPQDRITIVDRVSEGHRPAVAAGDCGACTLCLEVCPGSGATATQLPPGAVAAMPYSSGYGPVLEIWEGHAADPEIRKQGSSGGALTALALFGLEAGGMGAVVHIGQDPLNPFANRTFFSRSRSELLARAGSRYAPASACDRLREVEAEPEPVLFIGQPSEITALKNARRLRPELSARIGVTLSFFCAGSPAMLGTLELVQKQGVNPNEVGSIRYRGDGWPGNFRVIRKGEREPAFEMTYRDSWRFVQAYRPFSVQLWPDGTGADADISCGDPWYEKPKEGDHGFSLVVVRTERGREFVRRAVAAGMLHLTPAAPWKLERSQESLIRKRGSVWGRLLVLKCLRLRAPHFENYGLFQTWRSLSWGDKLRSTVGTARRVLFRGLWRPLDINAIPTTGQYLADMPAAKPADADRPVRR